MTDTETAAPSVRDTVEAAYASHTPSPDIDSIVSGAVEHRDREVRTRDRASPRDSKEYEGDRSDRLRQTIRGAIHQKKLEAATGSTQPARKHEAQPGPPASWNLEAKAQWPELPQETRLATLREQSETLNALESKVAPHLREHAEIKEMLAPVRERYARHGLRSDAEAVSRLVQWEAAIAHPQTRVQAVAEIMVQNGITVHDLFALAGAPQAYQQYAEHYAGDPVAQQMQDQQGMQEAHQQLTQFSQGKPHFENVRFRMGELIRDHGERYMSQGGIDLAKAYNDACREAGLGDNRARRSAAVSPASRSPAVAPDTPMRGGSSVRNSIIAAYQQSRG
jgi:hypothetical protein